MASKTVVAKHREYLNHFRGWLARNWFEVVGSSDEKHFWAGTSADPIKSQFGILRYVSGYVSNSDQTRPGFKVGRYWGIVGRSNVPWAKESMIELTQAQGKLVRRMTRRYMQAMNRKRRIGYLEKLLPKSLCSAWLLNGDVRHFRKQNRNLKIFKRFPRKLRLKNNGNVNLFCKADFWREAIIKAVCCSSA